MNPQILVLGMHRSGTSATAGLLERMGAYFGPQDQAMPPRDVNPKGFHERMDVALLNDRILAHGESTWIDCAGFDLNRCAPAFLERMDGEIRRVIEELDQGGAWYLKDPRLCLTLPRWLRQLAHPLAIIVVRNPLQIARSLEKRKDGPIQVGLALWELYTRSIFRSLADCPRLFLSYDRLLSDPRAVMDGLMDGMTSLGFSGLSPCPDPESWLDQEMAHHTDDEEAFRDYANPAQIRLYTYLQSEGQAGTWQEPVSRPALDALEYHATYMIEERTKLYDLIQSLSPDASHLQELRRELAGDPAAGTLTSQALIAYRNGIHAALDSMRWRGVSAVVNTAWRMAGKPEKVLESRWLMDRSDQLLQHHSALECAAFRPTVTAPLVPPPAEGRQLLLTELGSRCSGDEALYVAALRRLVEAGWAVTAWCRVPMMDTVRAAVLPVTLMTDLFMGAYEASSSLDELAGRVRDQEPFLHSVLVSTLTRMDAVAIAPGGRFLDEYALARKMVVAAVAVEQGVPVVQLPQSFGPVEAMARRGLLTDLLRHSRCVAVRDDFSHAFASEALSEPADRLVRSRDLIFAEDYPRSGAGPTYRLGVNLRVGFNGHVTEEALFAFLDRMTAKIPPGAIAVLTTTHDLPPEWTVRLRAGGLAVFPEVIRYPSYLDLIGRCDVHVTDSFHGWIFAMQADRPCAVLQPDFRSWKLQGTLAGVAPGSIPVGRGLIGADDVEGLVEEVQSLFDSPDARLRIQREILQQGRELAQIGWEQVLPFLPKVKGS